MTLIALLALLVAALELVQQSVGGHDDATERLVSIEATVKSTAAGVAKINQRLDDYDVRIRTVESNQTAQATQLGVVKNYDGRIRAVEGQVSAQKTELGAIEDRLHRIEIHCDKTAIGN